MKLSKLMKTVLWSSVSLAISQAIFSQPIAAQSAVEDHGAVQNSEGKKPEIFTPDWYNGYKARTIYEMVAATPGIAFALEGEDTSQRGLGTQANLLLVNGKPLTGKPIMKNSSLALEVLGSMKASELKRIEVYRTGSDKFQQKTDQLLVNVVLKGEGTSINSDWAIRLWQRGGGSIKPTLFLNTTRRSEESYLNISGAVYSSPRFNYTRNHEYSNTFDPTTNYIRDHRYDNNGVRIGFRWSRPFAGDGTLNLEGTMRRRFNNGEQEEYVWDGAGLGQNIPSDATLEASDLQTHATWGILNLNIDKPLSADWRTQFVLVQSADTSKASNLYRYNAAEPHEQLDLEYTVGETIARSTTFFQHTKKRQLRFGGELAYNFRDQAQNQYLADESGTLSLNSLDNSDAFVDEWRGEAFAFYNWRPSKAFFIEIGNVLEISRIAQSSNNISQSRQLVYSKPFLQSTYEITDKSRLSITIEREVGQLDFAQFISSVDREDYKIDSGNPDLAPIQTWNISGQIEHTLADKAGTIRLKLFHLWDEDVPERILGANGNGAAGNIGSGKRYGAELGASLRLDKIGIKDAKLDGTFMYEGGDVIDPFVMRKRFYSDRPHSTANIAFSQTLKSLGLTYGGEIDWRSGWFIHDAESIEYHRYGAPQLNFNIEKKFQNGMAIGLEFDNLLNKVLRREKTFYTADRASIESLQTRFVDNGVSVKMNIKGNF